MGTPFRRSSSHILQLPLTAFGKLLCLYNSFTHYGSSCPFHSSAFLQAYRNAINTQRLFTGITDSLTRPHVHWAVHSPAFATAVVNPLAFNVLLAALCLMLRSRSCFAGPRLFPPTHRASHRNANATTSLCAMYALLGSGFTHFPSIRRSRFIPSLRLFISLLRRAFKIVNTPNGFSYVE